MKNFQSIDISSCFAKRGDFVTRSIAGEMIIVPIRTQVADLNSIYNLNEVGMLIWSLLNGRTSIGQIAHSVCAEFDVTADQAEKDTLEFIAAMEAAGIVGPSEQKDQK